MVRIPEHDAAPNRVMSALCAHIGPTLQGAQRHVSAPFTNAGAIGWKPVRASRRYPGEEQEREQRAGS